MFLVPKKDGGVRVVQDFRALNANSHDDRYSMKNISECIGDIGRAGSTIFSTLDLTSGFWQMPLDEKSKHLTAFSVPGMGQFEWVMSPMGLLGCPASFQRLVEAAMKGLVNIIVYIDDILLHTSTHQQHREILGMLFQRLRETGLKVNLAKCEFGAVNVSYLGFRLTPNGILPGKDKLQAVANTPAPSNVHQVRQFLGLCNFFRTHIKNFSLISCPLNKLTRKDCPWRGGLLPPDALKAYKELKQMLVSEPIVDYPRKDRPYSLIVDAATGGETHDGGLGAILTQTDEKGQSRVIAYASRALVNHEKNYTPFLLEMLAATWAMDHFDTYLKGRKFQLFTDHRPLEKLGTVHSKTLNRLQEQMMSFDFTIHYKKGSEMPADFLSRNACEAINVFDKDLPALQEQDEACKVIRDLIRNNDEPKNMKRPFKNPAANAHALKMLCTSFIEDDILWTRINKENGVSRTVLWVPKQLTESLIQEAHGQLMTGHDGISKTKERLKESYFWLNMDADIAKHIQACQRCQQRKPNHPQPVLLSPLPQCTAPNQRVHIDLFGPLKTSDKGKKMILCMTDAFTKYVELVALDNKEAETTGAAIFSRWICRFGTPLEIVSDNGKEFCNKLVKELYRLMDIEHITTTPYHPQCNAQAEVCNKTIAKYLNSFVDQTTLDWEQYLAPLAFSYNTSIHRAVKSTPFFLTFGQDARLPSFPSPDIQRYYGETATGDWFNSLQLARQLAVQNNMKATDRYEADHNKKAQPYNYQVGQMVWLDERNFLHKNRKLAANWSGPYPILKVTDHGNVHIRFGRREINVNVDRIKPYKSPLGLQERSTDAEEKLATPQPEETQTATQQEQEAPKPQETQMATPQEQKPATSQYSESQPAQKPAEEEKPAQEEPWIEVKKRGRPKKASQPEKKSPEKFSKRGRGAPETKSAGPPPRMTRLQARLINQRTQQQGAPVELIKKQAQFTPREQQLWENCLINARREEGPSFLCDEYGLPKLINGVTQPEWVHKRRAYLKSLSVSKRNLLLTGDSYQAFDPVSYSVSTTLIIRRRAPANPIPAPDQVAPADPVPAPAPVAPADPIPAPAPVVPADPVPVPANPIPVPVQVAPADPIQPVPAPAPIAPPDPEPEEEDPELYDLPPLESDSAPVSPQTETIIDIPEPEPLKPKVTPVPPVPVYPTFEEIRKRVQLEQFIKQNFEDRERRAQEIAQLEAQGSLQHRPSKERLDSTSSESSNYDTPASSPTAAPAKVKGALKKNLDHVTNALAFSFNKDKKATRSSVRVKDPKWTSWPPKSQ